MSVDGYLVRNAQLKYFAYYCFTVGALAIAYHFICDGSIEGASLFDRRGDPSFNPQILSHPSGGSAYLLEASTERYSHIEGWRDSHLMCAVRAWKVKRIS